MDEDTSRNEEVINRLGDKTVYEYDINGRTKKVINKSSNDEELTSVSYDYDEFNNLKEITRGDNMQYSLVYNSFHNLESINIKGKPESLVSYTYKKGNGRLKEIAYANGNVMKAVYNGDGQLLSEKWYSASTEAEPMAYYKYVYDNSGNIVRSIDIKALKEYNYTYESGRIIRAAEYNITLDENLNVIAKNVVSSIEYAYNEKGMLGKKTVSVDGSEIVYNTEYPENGTPVIKVKVNGRTVESHSKTDSFGRKVFDEIQLGSGFVSRQFSYHAGKATAEHKQSRKLKSSPTTSLVSGIVLSNGTTLSYAYDPEERITSVTESYEVEGVPVVKVTSYTYDALGQLITETSDGVTTKFQYDNYGNILAKGVVDETGEIAEATKITYAYDENWKDLLISYNGQSIVYDAQGNPTEYLGHTLTWEKGRQLKSFDGNTYTYNANGIRTSKTVDGIRHDFALDGAKILKETWGENSLVPIYDNSDSVCGIIYNGTAYYFLKNLQGDIIAITNDEGETVARYSYDAWGVVTITQDVTECGIATVNPYRYRGYYFDAETGLYYLQSRYYDATTGRFLNSDSPEYVSVQGGNLFAYCGNCPTKNADYLGFCYVPTYPESYGEDKISENKIKEIYNALSPNVYWSYGVIETTILDLYFFRIVTVGGSDVQTNGSAIVGFLQKNDEIEATLSIPIYGIYSLGLSLGRKGMFNTFTIALYTSLKIVYSSIGIKFYFSPILFTVASVVAIAYCEFQLQRAWLKIKQALLKVLPYAILTIIIAALIYFCPYLAAAFV